MFMKREKKDDCTIAGLVVVDTKEKEYNGEKYLEFALGMGKDENGNNLPLVNVSVWGRSVDVKKGDRVAVFGKLKKTTKDDKVYYSMSADCVIKEISVKNENPPQPELTEIDDDTLPF